MDQQISTTESSSPSNDELEIQDTEPIITTATTSESLLSNSSVPKTFCWFPAHAIIDGNFKSYVLSFVPLLGSHSGSLLLQKYEEIINAFGVKNKVILIVTDSAANNIGAFQGMIIPGFEKYFIKDDNDEINDEDDSKSDMNNGEISDEYEYPSDFSSTTISSSTSIGLTLNDLIQESLNRLMENNEKMFLQLQKLVHTSTKFAEKLDLMKLSIPRAVITRWNSQFMCVERILSIPSIELNEVLAQLKHKNLCLSTRDLSMLQEFVALLSLFAEATTATQRQNSPSISFVTSSVLAIYFDLIDEKKNIQYATALCDALLSPLLLKFGGLLEQMEVDLNELNINFQMNKKFYDPYKDPVFFLHSSMECLKFVGLLNLYFLIQQKNDYVKKLKN
ncbi:unnamed protein product, partial [Rotaria sp. Silwood2]